MSAFFFAQIGLLATAHWIRHKNQGNKFFPAAVAEVFAAASMAMGIAWILSVLWSWVS